MQGGAKPAAAKPAASKADYSRPRQTIVEQSILISAVLPASLMPLFLLFTELVEMVGCRTHLLIALLSIPCNGQVPYQMFFCFRMPCLFTCDTPLLYLYLWSAFMCICICSRIHICICIWQPGCRTFCQSGFQHVPRTHIWRTMTPGE